ncbi:MAG: OPT/YSL family transporter [Fusobacteria bacterium]|nr:OPT/YSL family transporter [Fusobacteriota bacterium]
MRKKLPESAYRPLKTGEVFEPIMSPKENYREATLFSIIPGIFFTIIFTFALMFLSFKLGLGISADVPVAIIGLGMATTMRRTNALGEVVVMFSMPYTASGIMVTGTFLLPTFVILGMHINYIDVFFTIILGGFLGMIIGIIYRDYFCNKMHGILPFPGSFGTAEMLVAAEGGSAKVLIISGIIGFCYDLITQCIGLWNEVFSTSSFKWGNALMVNDKMNLQLDVSAAFLGVGYFTGIRYSSVIAAGGILGSFVLTPLIAMIVAPGHSPEFISMTTGKIYSGYIKTIGVGALVTAGIVSLITMLGVIRGAIGDVFKQLIKPSGLGESKIRTEKDLSPKTLGYGIIIVLIATALFIFFRIANHNILFTLVAMVIIIVFTIAFSIIASLALAYTSNEPVSGMTILMLLVAALAFIAIKVPEHDIALLTLMVACIVITMLGQAGYVVGLFKEAQLLGSTPRTLQIWGLVSIVISAPIIIAGFLLLDKAFGFVGTAHPLAAPQANAFASVLTPFISGQPAPWILYGIGAAITIVMFMLNVPIIPFAMGLYLPISLVIPFFVGGVVSWFVGSRSKDAQVNAARKSRGVVIASGLIAGGSLAGCATAVLAVMGINPMNSTFISNWQNTNASQILGLVALICLIMFVVTYASKAKVTREIFNKPKRKLTREDINKAFDIEAEGFEIID